MRALVSLRTRSLLFLLTAVAAFIGARAQADVDPLWDHYKVYEANPKLPGPTFPVYLHDQFTDTQHQVENLDKFMNPVRKIHLDTGVGYGITVDTLHYTWWKITPYPFSATVKVLNQFGNQTLNVYDAVYLLNPALKNYFADPSGVQTPVPYANHYKCYRCQGALVTRPIRMIDQFDQWDADVFEPRFFCNPTEKRITAAQPPNPIVDLKQHYVCYEFSPRDPNPFYAYVRDQFLNNNQYLSLYPAHLLCVPTEKGLVTATTKTTWGKLKLLYK